MSKTDDQIQSSISANESRADWGAWAVVLGLVLEVILATAKSLGYDHPGIENWGGVIADCFVALGVICEIHFGRKASEGTKELRRRSDERAAQLEKEAAEARLAYERLKDRLGGRGVSDEEARNLISVLSKGQRGSITIEYVGGDAEVLALVFVLKDIIEHSGWTVACAAQTMYGILIFGLFIPGDNSDPMREHVRGAFASAGLGFSTEEIPMFGGLRVGDEAIENSVKIFVGAKPIMPL
jgi:hypothetical protein